MNKNDLKIRGQTALNDPIEEIIVKRLITCGEWGYPMDTFDLRIITKGYLDRQGIKIGKFKNNSK